MYVLLLAVWLARRWLRGVRVVGCQHGGVAATHTLYARLTATCTVVLRRLFAHACQGTYAIKHTTFWMLPNVLVFTLVRFSPNAVAAGDNAAFVAAKVATTCRAAPG